MSSFLANKTVLVPFDFSDEASEAISEAIAMADESTKIHVLHVVVPVDIIPFEPNVHFDLGNDLKRLEGSIKLMKEKVAIQRKSTEYSGRIGDPGSEIAKFANEIDADLIVMPSHGRTGIRRLLLGSVAERVVRIAECPVMVLRKKKTD